MLKKYNTLVIHMVITMLQSCCFDAKIHHNNVSHIEVTNRGVASFKVLGGQGFHRGGGHWPRKRVWGCAAPKTPFASLSCSSQGSHYKQKSQFTRPLLRNFWTFSLYSLNFHSNVSSWASKFGNFQLTSPQIWKFSAHKTPFQRQILVRKPHTSEIRATHPYRKRVKCPQGVPLSSFLSSLYLDLPCGRDAHLGGLVYATVDKTFNVPISIIWHNEKWMFRMVITTTLW